MNLLGQPGGHVRPPLLAIDDPEELEAMREILDQAGLLENASSPRAAA